MAPADPVRAMVAYLRSDSRVAALASSRVFADELPQAEGGVMPRSAIVVASAGGGFLGAGQNYGDRRLDFRVYGATLAKARELHNTVRLAMKNLEREQIADSPGSSVLIHWARLSADGTAGRDAGTDWPIYRSTWQILASDIPT